MLFRLSVLYFCVLTNEVSRMNIWLVKYSAARSKAVILLFKDPLFIAALNFCGKFCVWYLFRNTVICVLSGFLIASLRKRELVALL